MLQISGLTARYQDEEVLRDISFDITAGQFVVILGPSGCGKTTLLNLIAGFLTPFSGDIWLNGKPVTGPGVERGVVFQHEGLMPWLNVLDNVALGLKFAGVSKKQRLETARQIIHQVGLSDYEDKYIWQLSGGQRQRVGIARALAVEPQLLLLDEPFAALDAYTREQMQELLLTIWCDSKKQCLLITHDIEEAIFMATNLYLMESSPGRIVERITLDFGQRFADGECSRSIKSDPNFIICREYVLERVFRYRRVLV
ncbi:taurine ABC transporter ATP-binding subunit [Photorhabdus noenieputensis]|uniref:taurine ABC transporter ATP-binding subunit n=1 Tax=Photorhabdus noenieputensis TaxID=1208607 RepID=UPI001BD40276|nr:taurine ABC transporter ATP-binding subunit [Photorhabdus noenieputensis]MBS9439309.1 taurine ABC transporter ATP-binding subunit [Photorhabdus noenieputensis]MCK3671496.1 taurine ABC transporter ATP-binding subunit [Photorhabdus noenieputensis]